MSDFLSKMPSYSHEPTRGAELARPKSTANPDDPTQGSDWDLLLKRLVFFYCIYLICWFSCVAAIAVGEGMYENPDLGGGLIVLGKLLAVAMLLAYIVCIILSYKIQSALNESGLYKAGAWQIVVAGVILNPGCVGFYVPLSVILTARRIRKKLALESERLAESR
jgi:hypothetical protein